MGIHSIAWSTLPPPGRNSLPVFPGQGTLLAASLEHLPAWTLHSVQQLQQQLLKSSFHFSSVFRDLCLQQLLFPKVMENLDAFMFFFPQPLKKKL